MREGENEADSALPASLLTTRFTVGGQFLLPMVNVVNVRKGGPGPYVGLSTYTRFTVGRQFLLP